MKAYIIYRQLYDPTGEHILIGGIETYLFSLFGVLVKAGYTPVVIQCATKNFSIMHNDQVQIRGYQTRKNASMKAYIKELYSCIRNELKAEDLVIFGTDTNSPKVKHKKTLAIQHGIDFDYYPMEEKKRCFLYQLGLWPIVKWVQRRRAKKSFDRTTYRVCVDYNFWNWYRTFSVPALEKNIFVVPNFTEIPDFHAREYDAKRPVQVILARRFVRRRGISVFIRAIEKLNGMGVNAEYTFAGSGVLEPQIDELMAKYPNIRKFSYSADQAIKLLQQYDISVVPTIGSEGTSFSLLESMAAGNAVICTPVGGMSNIILNGYNGLFVMPDSDEDLANSIRELVENFPKRNFLAQKAYETAKHSFSHAVWEEKWLKILSKIDHRA